MAEQRSAPIGKGWATKWCGFWCLEEISWKGRKHNCACFLLRQVYIPDSGKDQRIWTGSTDGLFSVASFSSILMSDSTVVNPLASIWTLKAPPRVIAFGWLTLRGRVLTLDNFHWRGRIIVNACPMCLANEETVDHIFLNCRFTQLYGGPWSSYGGWKLATGPSPGRILRKLSFMAISWTLWKERN